MKKYTTAILTLLIIGGVSLAPFSSVLAADEAKAAEVKKAEPAKGAKAGKKEEEEPECD